MSTWDALWRIFVEVLVLIGCLGRLTTASTSRAAPTAQRHARAAAAATITVLVLMPFDETDPAKRAQMTTMVATC